MKKIMCPICKVGEMIEHHIGASCSRRYAEKDPCDFESGWCNSAAEYKAVIARYRRKKRAAEREAIARAMCAR